MASLIYDMPDSNSLKIRTEHISSVSLSAIRFIQELQMFMEYFPTSSRRQDAQQMIFDLQDKLVMKDYLAAKLYYDKW